MKFKLVCRQRVSILRFISLSAVALVLLTLATTEASRIQSLRAADSSQGDGGVSEFYSWDKEIPDTPGKLLRQEPLPESLTLASASRSIRILYTSIDGIDGKTPIAVSGAVYFPKGALTQSGWPIIAWAHGTTGIADVCAPSWMARSQRDSDYLNAWLAQGYAVVATDYQGLGTPGLHLWEVVNAEANSVLDAIRAAISAFPELANTVVIVGQSQGAHAALSAALAASKYAPSVKLKATVATGVPNRDTLAPDTKAPQTIPIPARTGSGLNAVVALINVYSLKAIEPRIEINDYVSDIGKPVFELAQTVCLTDLIAAATQRNVTVENALKKLPDVKILRRYQKYPTPEFMQPVFVGTGLSDVTAFPEGQYDLVVAACKAGSNVETHYYAGKDHNSTVLASLIDSEPFVRKAFANSMIAGNCGSVKAPVPDR